MSDNSGNVPDSPWLALILNDDDLALSSACI